MNSLVKSLFFAAFSMLASFTYAQEQQEIQPEEIAAKQVEYLETQLKLNASQAFYVDSILVHNFRAQFDEFEDLKASGRQNANTYKFVNDKWLQRNMDALKLVLDEQQYIMYLKYIGKGQEYKRGKDGLYYTKEELAKMKGKKK